MDYNYATWVGPIEGPDRILGNFDLCVRMTEAALKCGCDVEKVPRYNPLRPSLLFDLAGRQPLGMVDFLTFVKALKYCACTIQPSTSYPKARYLLYKQKS